MTPLYDRERDEAYVPSTLPSRFLGWSEDVEAITPSWGTGGPAFVVVKHGGVYSITRGARLPWWRRMLPW